MSRSAQCQLQRQWRLIPVARLCRRLRHSSQMKTLIGIIGLVLSLFFFGCRRSYQDGDLIGSWQMTTNGITQTHTFSPDHTVVSAFVSSKDLRHFGDWTLDGDQLAIVVRSNSFSSTITSNRAATHILKLTDSVLILKDQDRNDEWRERTFRKLK